MPSTKDPSQIVQPGIGTPPSSSFGGSGALPVYGGGPPWADGTPNPSTSVNGQLTKIIIDLSSLSGGTAKLGSAAIPGNNTIPAGTLRSQLVALKSAANIDSASIVGTSGTIPAGDVHTQLVALKLASNHEYAGGGNWRDGTTNPATNVELQLDKFISDLTGQSTGFSGAEKLGCAGIIGASGTIPVGTIFSVLSALKNASNHEYAGGGTWADGSTNPATSVELQLDKFISDLGGSGGAAKVGATSVGNFTGTSVQADFSQLTQTTANNDGAKRVGAEAKRNYISLTVRGQLDDINLRVNALIGENWTDLFDVRPSFDTGVGPTCISYDPDRDWIWLVGGDTATGVILYSHNGAMWTELTSHLSGASAVDLTGVAFNQVGYGFASAGDNHVYNIPSADALSGGTNFPSSVVPSSGGHRGILRAEEEELFLLFGTSNTNHPAIWTIDDSGTIVSQTLPSSGGLTGEIALATVAAGGPHVVMADISGTFHQWDAPVLPGPWTYRGVVSFLTAPRGLHWSDEGFMVTCTGGQTYTSQNGTTWTLASLTAGASFQLHCLTSIGFVWVAVATLTSANQGAQRHLMYSLDFGVIWHHVPYPFSRTTVQRTVNAIDNRVALMGTQGELSLSHRSL